jgi:tRNA G46 methylase TrmB
MYNSLKSMNKRHVTAWLQATNHRRRIIQTTLLAEYAYLLAVGGTLYTITDVQVGTLWLAGVG